MIVEAQVTINGGERVRYAMPQNSAPRAGVEVHCILVRIRRPCDRGSSRLRNDLAFHPSAPPRAFS
jgi:hypothetical protein